MGTNNAFKWIIQLLELNDIPYLICGGLAANAYGSKRLLNDIDIFVPNTNYFDVVTLGDEYISYGPERYRDQHWDVEYVQFTYEGQKIEVGSSDEVKIFNSNSNSWVALELNFDSFSTISLLGRKVKVMNKSELVSYKSKLAREVDLIDVNEIKSA